MISCDLRRGLARRKKQRPRRIGIDETSFHKGAEYTTVVNDLDQNRVLWVGDNRRKQSGYKDVLDGYSEVRPVRGAVKWVHRGRTVSFGVELLKLIGVREIIRDGLKK